MSIVGEGSCKEGQRVGFLASNTFPNRTFSTMGGGARYPYPKEVWSPSGGWWTRPKNWAANTAIAGIGIAVVTYYVFKVSARNEWRYIQPDRPIPSMLWAHQYKEKASGSNVTSS
ncbi:hypothetical protein BU17DRAFT_70358 [Hysterangium stoloniferum]|nr:hypothetical protein BU17DRAFT_70358 [Hysterangium stoloniferum]